MPPLLAVALACVSVAAFAQPVHGSASPRSDRARATAAYAALQHRFFSPTTHLYRDSNAGAHEASAAAWSFSQAFAATLAVAQLPAPLRDHRRAVADRVWASAAYWDARAQPPAYAARVTNGSIGLAHFYDDNDWLGLDLVAASQLLQQRSALAQAERVFALVRSGWDTNARASCPGGVFWTHWEGITDRNTVSTANAALLALRLYEVVGAPSYLTWAKRMYVWVTTCLTRNDGLIADHIRGDGSIDERAWTYNQGAMIAVGALLYRATDDERYLRQAEDLAVRSLAYFGNFRTDPPIFVAIFFGDLRALAELGDDVGLAALRRYADTAWSQRRMGSRSALFRFGRPPTILDQAAMVQIYATLANSGLP